MAAQLVQVEQLDPDAVTQLVAAIIAGTPRLPGAACCFRPSFFDDKHPRRDPRAAPPAAHGCRRSLLAVPGTGTMPESLD